MPSRNARIDDENQEGPSAPRYDIADPKGLEKFVNALSAIAMTRESPHAGERKNAVDASVSFLRSHGLRWSEIIEGWAKYRGLADATHTALLSQIAAQQAEISARRARAADTSKALWNTVEAKVDHRIVARREVPIWGPTVAQAGELRSGVLDERARWTGRSPTAKQTGLPCKSSTASSPRRG